MRPPLPSPRRSIREEKVHRTQRERELAEALRETLRCFESATRLHPCPSCRTDYTICAERAKRLGVGE